MAFGKGHAADICANVVSILACHAPADDKTLSCEEEEAVMCKTSGKMSGALLPSGGRLKQKGGCTLDWQVGEISVICDNGASCHMSYSFTCHMSYSSTGMINYREAKTFMNTDSGTKYPIEGYGDLPLTFIRSGRGEVPLFLRDVAHVPCLSYHLFSLRVADDKRHKYTGTCNGGLHHWGEAIFPSLGRLNFLYAYRPNSFVDETANNATIAPGPMSKKHDTPTDINDFHVAHADVHEGALRKTAKQMGITLVGKIHEGKGCSLAKGIRMPIPSKTSNRAVKRLFRVFVDPGGKKKVKSIGGNKYPMIIIDDYSRYTKMYSISHKSDAVDTFAKFISDLRLVGIPSEVVVIRSDDGGEFSEGKFGGLSLSDESFPNGGARGAFAKPSRSLRGYG